MKGTLDQFADSLGLKIELTDEQRRMFDVLSDFYDPAPVGRPQERGRTTVAMLVHLKLALDNPDTRVPILDHRPDSNRRVFRAMKRRVEAFASSHPNSPLSHIGFYECKDAVYMVYDPPRRPVDVDDFTAKNEALVDDIAMNGPRER